eukprot:gnl/TRDRNA2_/TRDRNA2_146034_c0_seq1.p1 gnl/TRDRNA2_/TRDRNA2_146034_c0~~gnl/TRDRNA2_/TRDRNA2_146034_c0_seq1.p1  ORF type:complete len:550 (+),score=69.03 gnl/TRDRNA2_/TRDRNA2_146034_c0_seq1:61-1710(+)
MIAHTQVVWALLSALLYDDSAASSSWLATVHHPDEATSAAPGLRTQHAMATKALKASSLNRRDLDGTMLAKFGYTASLPRTGLRPCNTNRCIGMLRPAQMRPYFSVMAAFDNKRSGEPAFAIFIDPVLTEDQASLRFTYEQYAKVENIKPTDNLAMLWRAAENITGTKRPTLHVCFNGTELEESFTRTIAEEGIQNGDRLAATIKKINANKEALLRVRLQAFKNSSELALHLDQKIMSPLDRQETAFTNRIADELGLEVMTSELPEPQLVITRPQSYLEVFAEGSPVPVVLGATRQESDFSPGDDVRNFTRADLGTLVAERLGGDYGDSFVHELLDVYGLLRPGGAAPFEAQRVYSDIVSDATTVCPNFYLAQTMSRSRRRQSPGVYAYAAAGCLSGPFCVLEQFNSFSPPYCPLYAFHASDEFAMIRPAYSESLFPYHFSTADAEYGQLIWARLSEFAATGEVLAWKTFAGTTSSLQADQPKTRRHLSEHYFVSELGTHERRAVSGYRREQCNFWLRHGFYDTHGLINVESEASTVDEAPLDLTSILI